MVHSEKNKYPTAKDNIRGYEASLRMLEMLKPTLEGEAHKLVLV